MAGVQVLDPVCFECAADVLKRVVYLFLTVGFFSLCEPRVVDNLTGAQTMCLIYTRRRQSNLLGV